MSTTFLCGQVTRFPCFRNRFFVSEQSHKSCLKFSNSFSLAERFFTWSVTHKGDVFNGILGAWSNSKSWVWYGEALESASLRLKKIRSRWKNLKKESFCASNHFTDQFSVHSNRTPLAWWRSSMRCWQPSSSETRSFSYDKVSNLNVIRKSFARELDWVWQMVTGFTGILRFANEVVWHLSKWLKLNRNKVSVSLKKTVI